MVAAPDVLRGTGWRRRVAAVGVGFGGLTATKALRHAEVNITDAAVFLVRIIAQGTSYVVNQTPPWLQVIPAITGLAATIGVLIALYVPRMPRRRIARPPSDRDHCYGTTPVVTHIDTVPVWANRHCVGIAGHINSRHDRLRDRVNDREHAITEIGDISVLSVRA
jgi:hypothetical protein